MFPRTFQAFEHQRLSVSAVGSSESLSSFEADCLSLLGEEHRGFCERGHRSISLAQFCGIVSLGERTLEVLPKVDKHSSADKCRGILLRLLRQADGFEVFDQLPVGQHLHNAPLLEIFIASFFDQVTLLVRGGLLRQYQEHGDDLPCVRGRIVTHRQFSVLINRADRVACVYDELTADNSWNRWVKRALKMVRPWIESPHLDRRWIELMSIFDEVRDEHLDLSSLNRLVFDRQATRYRATIEWVRWIFCLLSPNIRAGQNVAPGLLFDMNKLFESAIACRLHHSARRQSAIQLHSQHSETHLATVAGSKNHRAFNLRPDLVATKNGKFVAIGDTKWKIIGVRSRYLVPEQSDVYQMQAYAAAYQCEDLALIYPWHDGLEDTVETTYHLPPIGNLQPKLAVLCVDVQSDEMPLRRGSMGSHFSKLIAFCGLTKEA